MKKMILKYREEIRGLKNKISAIAFILLLGLVFSCDNIKKEEKFDKNGNLKYLLYMKGGDTLKFFKSYDDGNKFIYKIDDSFRKNSDTIIEFYSNGNRMFEISRRLNGTDFFTNFDKIGNKTSEGLLFDQKNIGWWNFYSSGKLRKRLYFVQENDKLSISQMQVFDSNQMIIKSKSDFVEIQIPDTVFVGKSTGTIFYKKKLGKNSEEHIAIGYNLTPNFSNIHQVRVDTFYNKNNDGFFGIEMNKLGKQKIMGFINERKTTIENDTKANITSVNTYFEKDLFVVARPDSMAQDKVMRYDNLKR